MIMKMHSYLSINGELAHVNKQSERTLAQLKKATEAVIDIVNAGVGIRTSSPSSSPPSLPLPPLTPLTPPHRTLTTECVELCDSNFMKSTNLYGQSLRKYPELDSLFFKFQGPTPRALAEAAQITEALCERHGGTGFALARSDAEAAALWADRKNALYSGLALREGSRGWSTDVCVPVSRLPQLVLETKQDIESSGIVSTIVGHVGDGTPFLSPSLNGRITHIQATSTHSSSSHPTPNSPPPANSSTVWSNARSASTAPVRTPTSSTPLA